MSSAMEYKSHQNFDFSLGDNILDERESFSPKVKVIYFSPTGTTKKIIKNVIKGIESKQVEYVDLTKDNRISKKEKIDTTKDDLIILGAPVYGGFLYKEFRNYIIEMNERVPVLLAKEMLQLCFQKERLFL